MKSEKFRCLDYKILSAVFLSKSAMDQPTTAASSSSDATDNNLSSIASPANVPALSAASDANNQQTMRNIKLLVPPQSNQSIALPDSFYDLSSSEIKQIYASSSANIEKPLMTKKMRDNLLREKQAKYPSTLIRVKMPDLTQIQLTFKSGERVSTLFTEIEKLVLPKEWKLFTSPPTKYLNPSITFWEHGLYPATLVYFGSNDKGKYLLLIQ